MAAKASTSFPSSPPTTPEKKERRKSLRERLISSFVSSGSESDDSSPLKSSRQAVLKARGGHGQNTDSNNNDAEPESRSFHEEIDFPRAGLRYKNAQGTEVFRSSPALIAPNSSSRSNAGAAVDLFRSEGHLPMYQQRSMTEPQEDFGTPEDTTTATAPKSANWRTKVLGSRLWKSNKKSSSEDVTQKTKKNLQKSKKRATHDTEDDEEASSADQPELSLHTLIKRGDVEDIQRVIALSRKKSKRVTEPCDEDDIVNVKNSLGSTPLHTAVEADNFEIVQILLRSGANPDIVDGIGWTPLLAACKAGNLLMAQALLQGAADVNAKTNDLNTPLHYLAGKSPKDEDRELYYEVMTQLLGKEGRVYGMIANNTTARNKNGDTPLHYAALHSKPDVVQWLLQHHAAVNNQNIFGDTALHCAVLRGDVEIARLLLKNGASKSLEGRMGTPKEIAKAEHANNVELLALF